MDLGSFVVWREARTMQLSRFSCVERVPLEFVGLYLHWRWRGVYLRLNVSLEHCLSCCGMWQVVWCGAVWRGVARCGVGVVVVCCCFLWLLCCCVTNAFFEFKSP